MNLALALAALGGCGEPPAPAPDRAASQQRTAAEEGATTNCGLASSCPELSVEPARCVDQPAWFEVTVMEGEVVAASLALDPAQTGLAPGFWYTIFPAATGACGDAVVAGFDVVEVLP